MQCVCIIIPCVRFARLLPFFLLLTLQARAEIRVVAGENFYGDVARQIGGDEVVVTSILNNPEQDPHLFTADVATAKALAAAQVAIFNGLDYDPWMEQLTSAHAAVGRETVNVSRLTGVRDGANPHIWYDPATMAALAERLCELFVRREPVRAELFRARLARFSADLRTVQARVDNLRAKTNGQDAIATEPVFGYMAAALGLKMQAMDFQNHVMNNVEPSVRETAEFEDLLRSRRVKILFYNNQVTDPVTARMQMLAKEVGVPIVGVTETEPAGKTYAAWMLAELDAVDRALGPIQP